MSQKHLFVMDPLESLDLERDTSLRLMQALTKRGHRVFACEMRDLQWSMGGRSGLALASELAFPAGLFDFEKGKAVARALAGFDGIHMRKDPPFDMDYVAATWLLESAKASAKIYNAPKALREFNEKLAIFQFPEACRDALVSADPVELMRFIEDSAAGDAVIKPLFLFGGRGVHRINLTDAGFTRPYALKLLEKETAGGRSYRLVQRFDPAIFDGEVRVCTIGGEPLAWCLKKPAPGQFLANTRLGASLHEYLPGPEELARVKTVAGRLWDSGVAFAGFDVIGSYISEINITSPRYLAVGDLFDSGFAVMAEWYEKDAAAT